MHTATAFPTLTVDSRYLNWAVALGGAPIPSETQQQLGSSVECSILAAANVAATPDFNARVTLSDFETALVDNTTPCHLNPKQVETRGPLLLVGESLPRPDTETVQLLSHLQDQVQVLAKTADGRFLKQTHERFTVDRQFESIQALPASFGPPQPPPPTPWTGDILKDASNLFAGWADKLTFGITSGIRQVFGYDDVIDYNSAAYQTGAAIGSLHNSLLMVTPGAAGGILGTVQKALNTAGQVGGAMSVIQALQAGDLLAAVEGVVSIGLASVRGVTACQRASRVAQWGQRALHGVAAARAIDAAYGNFNRGD